MSLHTNNARPPLQHWWEKTKNDDPLLLSLLEAFAYLAYNIKGKFQPYAQPVFRRYDLNELVFHLLDADAICRCLALIQDYYLQSAVVDENPTAV